MEIYRKTFDNFSLAVTTGVRKTSCSHGWLRLVIQYFFGAMTVISFILIVIMALRAPPSKSNNSRCTFNGCRVVCHQTPFLGEYEDEIFQAVASAEEYCKGIRLTLNEPHFENATLPPRWLQKLRSTVVVLEIVKGNLMKISSRAFMTHLGEELLSLAFDGITIERLDGRTLLGLIHLETLRIESSTLENIRFNALRSVDATLQNLFITQCGDWTPAPLTGSSNLVKLSAVEFSNNNFPILRNDSFTRLHACKVLYLDYCNISVIEEGAFNNLKSVEVIYLDHNRLVTVTPGLFAPLFSLTNPLPRISIHNNYWHCNCSNYDLRELIRRDMILVDTNCYSPVQFNGTSFPDFEYYCQKQNDTAVLRYNDTVEQTNMIPSVIPFSSGTCQNRKKYLGFHYPTLRLKCSSQITLSFNNSIGDNKKDKTEILPRFAIANSKHAMLEVISMGSSNYGLVWFQSLCPQEVYCVNVLPELLRIYDIDLKTKYTFCPIHLSTGNIQTKNCVKYVIEELDRKSLVIRIVGYLFTSIFFLTFGASCLYAIILKFPALLKGSKRILFVKHKGVDALILPSKVPLKTVMSKQSLPSATENNIFSVSDAAVQSNLSCDDFMSVLSRRSSKSMAPSYVSALEPTDDQLADWRLRHHFQLDSTPVDRTDSLVTSVEDGPQSFSSDAVYERCQCDKLQTEAWN